MADSDRPQLGDTPYGRSKEYKNAKAKPSAKPAPESNSEAVGKLIKDLATGGGNSTVYSARPDGRTDGGSGHDER